MARCLWWSTTAAVLIGLLGACGTEQPREGQQAEALAAAPAQGNGQGASVVRVTDGWFVGWYWNDYVQAGEKGVVAALSNYPDFLVDAVCGGELTYTGERLPYVYQWIYSASTRWAVMAHGRFYTRVYRATIPADGCALLKGEAGPLLAEGIAWGRENDNGIDCGVAPGFESIVLRGGGILNDPSCQSGKARFDMAFHYRVAKDAVFLPDCSLEDPADLLIVRVEGPDLKCIGAR